MIRQPKAAASFPPGADWQINKECCLVVDFSLAGVSALSSRQCFHTVGLATGGVSSL